MAKLFDMVGTDITLDANILAVPALQKIWDRDKSKGKAQALKELKFIVFLCDFLSPYKDLQEDLKEKTIIEDIFGEKWVPDNTVKEAITKYIQLQETPLMRFLDVNLKNIGKLTNYLDLITFEGKDEYEALKIVDSMTKSIEKAGGMIKSILTLKKQVQTEITEKNVRGQSEIGPYELPKQTRNANTNKEKRVSENGDEFGDES